MTANFTQMGDRTESTAGSTTFAFDGDTVRVRKGRIIFDGEDFGDVTKVETVWFEMAGPIRTGRHEIAVEYRVCTPDGDHYFGPTIKDAVRRMLVGLED